MSISRFGMCAVLVALFACGVQAQASELQVEGSMKSGEPVTFGVRYAPANSPTVLLVSSEAGTTDVLPGLMLDLGGFPFVLAQSYTDFTGKLTETFTIPSLPGFAGEVPFWSQAITVPQNESYGSHIVASGVVELTIKFS